MPGETGSQQKTNAALLAQKLRNEDGVCFSHVVMSPQHVIFFAFTLVKLPQSDESLLKCIDASIFQIAGFKIPLRQGDFSVFTSGYAISLLTDYDLVALRALYSPSLLPGSTRAEAINEIRREVKAGP